MGWATAGGGVGAGGIGMQCRGRISPGMRMMTPEMPGPSMPHARAAAAPATQMSRPAAEAPRAVKKVRQS